MSNARPSPRELKIGVEGIGFWASQLPSWECARSVFRGERLPEKEAHARPVPTLLAPTERRRAPDTVAIALEVAASACRAARREPNELDSVFASSFGDLAIADYMCSTLSSSPELISPTKFHNSVHNAAAGYWCIGSGTHAAYTALSAHDGTFASGLVEAAVQAHCGERPILFVAYDIEAVGAMAGVIASRGLLAVAMVLTADVERAQATLGLRMIPEPIAELGTSRSTAADFLHSNALSSALPFLAALALDAKDRETSVALPLNDYASLRVSL